MQRRKAGFLTQLVSVVLIDVLALPPAQMFGTAVRTIDSQASHNNSKSRTNSAAGGGRLVAAPAEASELRFGGGAAGAPGATSVTLHAAADATIANGQPNTNRGALAWLEIGPSSKTRAVVRFSQSEIATAIGQGQLQSASLRVFVVDNQSNWGANGGQVGVHLLEADWSESAVTWNCAIDTDPANNRSDCERRWNGGALRPATSRVLHTDGLAGWVSFEVTADVRAFMAGTPNFGWALVKEDGTSGAVRYGAREGMPDEQPRLVLSILELPTPTFTPDPSTLTATPAPVATDPDPTRTAITPTTPPVRFFDLTAGAHRPHQGPAGCQSGSGLLPLLARSGPDRAVSRPALPGCFLDSDFHRGRGGGCDTALRELEQDRPRLPVPRSEGSGAGPHQHQDSHPSARRRRWAAAGAV